MTDAEPTTAPTTAAPPGSALPDTGAPDGVPPGGALSERVLPEVPEPGPYASRRFWSPRRVPSVLVALVGLAACGALLFDVVVEHVRDRRAMWWRRELAEQLGTRHLDDVWVLVGAGAAVVVGLWLLWLAVTPGMRAVLPMRTPSTELRAGIDRRAAALVLRDSALRVAGVGAARVTVGRRRARVRADVHFRDVAEVSDELRALLTDDLRRLGLVRRPRLTLHLREVDGS